MCKKIGSADNYKEVSMKIKQNCQTIIFSRLFTTNYINKKNYYGIIKFNLIAKNVLKQIFPLGGIRNSNLLKLIIDYECEKHNIENCNKAFV